MNWSKVISMLGPIISVILAVIAANNSTVISYGAADPSLGEYASTGLAGLGALATLALSIFTSWRQSGRVEPKKLAALAALGTLSGIFHAAVDEKGNNLVTQLSVHMKELHDAEPKS